MDAKQMRRSIARRVKAAAAKLEDIGSDVDAWHPGEDWLVEELETVASQLSTLATDIGDSFTGSEDADDASEDAEEGDPEGLSFDDDGDDHDRGWSEDE